MDVIRDQTAKANEAARQADNEFNIRKNFLDNTVNAIKDATLGQFNIVICTDQAGDDFQDLTGRILPMDLVDVEVGDGKTVNFQVYVFDTGKYLRRGKWERDHWWYYGETQKFSDIAMHVHFDTAQPKLNPDEVEQTQAGQDEQHDIADEVNAATQGGEGDGAEEGVEPAHDEEQQQEDTADPDAEETPQETEPEVEPEAPQEEVPELEEPEGEAADSAEPEEEHE